jgi:hypothetical protein
MRPVSSHSPNSPLETYRRHALGARPDQRELPVVDRPGPVHGDQGHEPALHQVDEVPLRAGPETCAPIIRTRAAPRAFASAIRLARWSGWTGARRAGVEREQHVEGEVVLAVGERLEPELRPVELRERHG